MARVNDTGETNKLTDEKIIIDWDYGAGRVVKHLELGKADSYIQRIEDLFNPFGGIDEKFKRAL